MYESSVFINCPFDDEYVDILQAITFTVVYCGFIPRSALEDVDSGQERLAKIVKLIKNCCLSLHDISRVEISKPGDLPRFNMPFECGIFYGASQLGTKDQKKKQFLVLDSEPYRYQKTMSDIAGKDPACHSNKPDEAIACVRRFLNGKHGKALAGEGHIVAEYGSFRAALPALMADQHFTEAEMRKLNYWKDYVAIVTAWVNAKAKPAAA